MKNRLLLTALLFTGAALVASAADAQANWESHCVKCHGADGKGKTKLGKKYWMKDLSNAKVQTEFTNEQAVRIMQVGLADKNGKTTMKHIEGLTEDELRALLPVIRALKK